MVEFYKIFDKENGWRQWKIVGDWERSRDSLPFEEFHQILDSIMLQVYDEFFL